MLYLILAPLLLGIAITILSAASRHADTRFVALIINVLSVAAPLVAVAPKLSKKSLVAQSYGLKLAIVCGLLVGIYALAYNKALSQNKVGIVTPIVYGGTIFLSTILSYFFYKEKVSLGEGLGLGLVLVGLIVIIYTRATTA